MSPLFQLVLFNNCFIQLLIPWMSPLFQLLFNFLFRWPPLFGRTFYSTTGFIQQLFYSTAYSLSLIPTGFIQQLFYSTAYSLDESLISTGFIQQLFYSTAYSLDESLIPTVIQLFIPMAALIWSHFLFNNWFYSTTVLFNCLFTVPYSNWFYSTTVLFNCLFPG